MPADRMRFRYAEADVTTMLILYRTLVFVGLLLGLVLAATTTISTSIKFTYNDVLARQHNSNSSSGDMASSTTSSASTADQIAVPVETNQFSHGLDFNDVILYLNSSDGHYHLKGVVTNTLHETRDNQTGIVIIFRDEGDFAFDNTKTINAYIDGPIDPRKSIPFEIDSGYIAAQADQMQHLIVHITY